MSVQHRSARHRSCLCLLVAGLFPCALAGSEASTPRLSILRRVSLPSRHDEIAQAARVAGQGYVVLSKPSTSGPVEFYALDGKFLRTISGAPSASDVPEKVMNVAVDQASRVLLADLRQRRITEVSPGGQVLDTFLVRKPSFAPHAVLPLDAAGRLYLAGCLPTHELVTQGCSLLHEYNLETHTYRRSFILTEKDYPGFQERNYLRLSYLHMDSMDARFLYVTDTSAGGFWILNVDTGSIQRVTVSPKILPEIPRIDNADQGEMIYRAQETISGVFDTGHNVVLATQKIDARAYSLLVFDRKGELLGRVECPGSVVGRTPEGTLLFDRSTDRGREIIEATLDVPTRRRP